MKELSGCLCIEVQHHPSVGPIVQRSQPQPNQSIWACTGTLDNNRQTAIFSRRDSINHSSNGPIVEDGNDNGDKEAGVDTIAIESASLNQDGSGVNELDSSNKDHSQDDSNANSHTQTLQGDWRNTEKINNSGGQGKALKEDVCALMLIRKIETSFKESKDKLETLIHSWQQSLWEDIPFKTRTQWHLEALMDMDMKDPARKIIHKMGLYRQLQEMLRLGTQHGCDNRNYLHEYRNRLIGTSFPAVLPDSDDHKNLHRRLRRYLEEGKVFHEVYILSPGFVALIALTLKQDEYDL